jgi:hypothetical protein
LRELRLASNTVLHELTDVLDEPPAAPSAKAPAPAAREPAPRPDVQPPAALPTEKT